MSIGSSILYFTSWVMKLAWFFKYVLTDQIDSPIAVVLNQVSNYIFGVSGLLVLMCCCHCWSIIFQNFRRRAVSNDDWSFLIYSTLIVVGGVHFVAVMMTETRTSNEYFYWDTSLSDMIARELIVIAFALAGAIIPARLARYEARSVQVRSSTCNVPCLIIIVPSFCFRFSSHH